MDLDRYCIEAHLPKRNQTYTRHVEEFFFSITVEYKGDVKATFFYGWSEIYRFLYEVKNRRRQIAMGYFRSQHTTFYFEFTSCHFMVTQSFLKKAKEKRLLMLLKTGVYLPDRARTFFMDHPQVMVQITEVENYKAEYYYGSDTIATLVQNIQRNLRGPIQGYFKTFSTVFHFDIQSNEDIFTESFLERLEVDTFPRRIRLFDFFGVFRQEGDYMPTVCYNLQNLNKICRDIKSGVRDHFSGHIQFDEQTISFEFYKPNILTSMKYRIGYRLTTNDTSIHYHCNASSPIHSIPARTILQRIGISPRDDYEFIKCGEIIGYVQSAILTSIPQGQFRTTTQQTNLFLDVNGREILEKIPPEITLAYYGNSPNSSFAFVQYNERYGYVNRGHLRMA